MFGKRERRHCAQPRSLTGEDPHAAYTAAGVNYQALDAGKRSALTEAFDDLTDAEPAEFLEVLQHREYPNLDAALTAARDATAGVHA